jgi:hypothetical protein
VVQMVLLELRPQIQLRAVVLLNLLMVQVVLETMQTETLELLASVAMAAVKRLQVFLQVALRALAVMQVEQAATDGGPQVVAEVEATMAAAVVGAHKLQ